MERSKNQKILLVISIIEILFAVLLILVGIMAAIGGAIIGSADPSQTADIVVETGLAQSDISGLATIAGVVSGLVGVLELVTGILGIRAANNSQTIMPVWILSIAGLGLNIANAITAIFRGSFGTQFVSLASGLVLAGLVFWIANNVKNEASR